MCIHVNWYLAVGLPEERCVILQQLIENDRMPFCCRLRFAMISEMFVDLINVCVSNYMLERVDIDRQKSRNDVFSV